eukprot:CAMPEP_0181486282 /NCGR_PEP_ID=MMETSP1110-20121109/47051_1 /TAXON_ID=174948 /ORGANISM="Symbiodinium sp., Strain CCMP421" /LENGTH=70 /DNA_ID=CAMNT_0023612409 /DNA_START=210 /DNA_END=419 /DNA_ORIENTATION=-
MEADPAAAVGAASVLTRKAYQHQARAARIQAAPAPQLQQDFSVLSAQKALHASDFESQSCEPDKFGPRLE